MVILKMTAASHAGLLVVMSLLSGSIAQDAGACTCKDLGSDGAPQLLSNCSGASLNDVPHGLDSNTTALDVSDNNITQLRNDTFSRTGILHLDKVFVKRNHIVGIESGTFRQLNSLSELHLESNLIASILPGTFSDNPKLVILNLRDNRLCSLPVDVITLKNHIKELDLGVNSIQKVDTYLVQRYYPALRILDVSRNRISRMFSTSPIDKSSLEVIDASSNYISELDPSAFSSASELKELNVSNNEIRNLTQDVFTNNPELVRVDVSNNHILTIHRDAFRLNPKITEIYAGSNEMTYLHPDTFSKNQQLTKVIVSWNNIKEIHPQTFYNNPNLEVIDLNRNQIKTLDPGVFQNNPILKSVDLRSNSLITIHETTFHGNPKLERLLMSKNEHIRFHDGLLIHATILKLFDAQHCNLSQLPVGLFKNTTELRELNLGNNNLTSLGGVTNGSNDYVDTLTKLQVLDLANNNLQTINVEVFTNNMTKLKSLRIEGNPFLCDCKLRSAWLWSQKEGIIPSEPQIICTDVQQRSIPWDDVQQLNCSDESLAEVSTSTVISTLNKHSNTSDESLADVSTSTVISTLSKHISNTRDESLADVSTSTVRSTVSQHLNSSDKSLTDASDSTAISAHRDANTESQHLNCSEKLPTEESNSSVTNTNRDHFNCSEKPLAEESTSTVIRNGSDVGTEPRLFAYPTKPSPQVRVHHNSTPRVEEISNKILIGVSVFFLLAVFLVILPLLYLMQRRYGVYKVSKPKSMIQNNDAANRAPAPISP